MPHLKHSFCFSAARIPAGRLSQCARAVMPLPIETIVRRAAEKQKENHVGTRRAINRPPLRGLASAAAAFFLLIASARATALRFGGFPAELDLSQVSERTLRIRL